MIKIEMKTLLLTTTLLMASSNVLASSVPVGVSVTTTGSSGNWDYNFSVTNNLGGTNKVYFFGVQDKSGIVVASPGNFHQSIGDNPASLGGPNIVYNDTWLSSVNSGIPNLGTLGGFIIHDTSVIQATSLNWFAFAAGGTYTGPGYFNSSSNPGFAGSVSTVAATPIPAAIWLFVSGLVGLMGFGKKKTFPKYALS